MRLDLATGTLTLEDAFGDSDGKTGFSLANRQWPDGWNSSGRAAEQSSLAKDLILRLRWFVGQCPMGALRWVVGSSRLGFASALRRHSARFATPDRSVLPFEGGVAGRLLSAERTESTRDNQIVSYELSFSLP
jgi:hypothetical protein